MIDEVERAFQKQEQAGPIEDRHHDGKDAQDARFFRQLLECRLDDAL